jgi:hypothetical protein
MTVKARVAGWVRSVLSASVSVDTVHNDTDF